MDLAQPMLLYPFRSPGNAFHKILECVWGTLVHSAKITFVSSGTDDVFSRIEVRALCSHSSSFTTNSLNHVFMELTLCTDMLENEGAFPRPIFACLCLSVKTPWPCAWFYVLGCGMSCPTSPERCVGQVPTHFWSYSVLTLPTCNMKSIFEAGASLSEIGRNFQVKT